MPANDCIPFFPSDYRGDPNVETLSYAAKGLWAEMFILMMMTGGILIHGGKRIREADVAGIAKATRGDVRDVRRIMPELKESGVYSIMDDGTIYSRKLVEMTAIRQQKSAAGRRGGEKSAQANATARAQAELLKQTSSGGAQSQSIPYHDRSPSGRDDAHAPEDPEALKAQADALSDYLLESSIEYLAGRGIQMAHWTGEMHGKWLLDNRSAAVVLVRSYGLEACKVRALAYVVAVRDGKIASRIINAAMLQNCWNYRELTDVVKAAVADGVSEQTRSFVDELRAEEQRREAGAA